MTATDRRSPSPANRSSMPLNWGAIALGAMAGLGLALLAALFLVGTGLADYFVGAALLIFLQYSSQVGAGYLAGRLASSNRVLHGGMAGIALAALGAVVGMSFNSTDSRLGLIILGLVIAAVSGSAGGALAEHRARP